MSETRLTTPAMPGSDLVELDTSIDVGATSAIAREKYEREAAIITAHQWPRNEAKAVARLEQALSRPAMADAFDVSVEALDLGRIEYQAGLDTLYNCRKAGVWPALGERIDEEGDLVPYIATFNLPPWAETHDGRRYSDIVRGDRS